MNKLTTLFKCPYIEECTQIIGYWDNKPVEALYTNKCKAPLLVNRKTGQTICAIRTDNVEGWAEAIENIGRRRRESK